MSEYHRATPVTDEIVKLVSNLSLSVSDADGAVDNDRLPQELAFLGLHPIGSFAPPSTALSPPPWLVQRSELSYVGASRNALLAAHGVQMVAQSATVPLAFSPDRHPLERPKRILSTETMRNCPHCGYATARTYNLVAHVRDMHHAQRCYRCDQMGCTRGYRRKRDLERHIQKAHPRG